MTRNVFPRTLYKSVRIASAHEVAHALSVSITIEVQEKFYVKRL